MPEVLDLEQWTEDSGISSDDTSDPLRPLGQSSGEGSQNNSEEHLDMNEIIERKLKEFAADQFHQQVKMQPAANPNMSPQDFDILPSESDRASPPLYEVELTASDEDDDASVLELVIPMKTPRYQRVPTSSPKKSKPKIVKRYICSLMCCGRKRK